MLPRTTLSWLGLTRTTRVYWPRSYTGSTHLRATTTVIPTRTFLDAAWRILTGQSESPLESTAQLPSDYRLLTAAEAAKYRKPPRRCIMLARDFVDDSLYNPHYGYFSKQATIFTVSDEGGFDFNTCKDTLEFMNRISARYAEIEGDLNDVNDIMRQVWHTPTELFKVSYTFI
jgi:hypothetical protein